MPDEVIVPVRNMSDKDGTNVDIAIVANPSPADLRLLGVDARIVNGVVVGDRQSQ